MLAITTHRQLRAINSIPSILRWITQNESAAISRSKTIQGAAPSRSWAWGVQEDSPTPYSKLERPSTSTAAVDVKTHCLELVQDVDELEEGSETSDINSNGQLHDDENKISPRQEFVPLGVEVGAPDPPNAEAVKAKSRALWLLSQRTYTRHRLHQKLLRYKKFPDDAVLWALDRVEASGHINDAAWSRDFASIKWRYSRWAAKRIRRELLHRGIDVKTAESTLEWLQTEGYQGNRNYGAVEMHGCNAEDAEQRMHVALVADARKRLVRLEQYPVTTRRRRLSSWLARLGHDWSTIQRVLQEIKLL